jgi:hypothetical protein
VLRARVSITRASAGISEGGEQLSAPQRDGRKHPAQQQQFMRLAVPEHLRHKPCRSQEKQGQRHAAVEPREL